MGTTEYVMIGCTAFMSLMLWGGLRDLDQRLIRLIEAVIDNRRP